MCSKLARALLGLTVATATVVRAEDVLGVYIFHRHGDRTAKAWDPVNLTALGADQAHSSGAFFHDRYVSDDGDYHIQGLSSDVAVLSQISVTAPVDAVLHNSAVTFLQGLYPPTGQSEALANGTKVKAPLNGYQYIPVDAVEDAATADEAESSSWIQGDSGCTNAEISSNNYLSSNEFTDTLDSTKDFYRRLLPVVNSSMSEDEVSFKNAYSVFDLINVARIHNSSIPSEDLLNESTVHELFSLASTHEWNLAYNDSDPVRAIAGSILTGQIVDALEAIVEGKSDAPPMNVQFGAYGTFMSFFGLAQLQKVSNDFYGVCNYASAMAFELVTNATNPTPDDISVRFLFSNGTAAENEFKTFPLFGQDKTTLSWSDFKSGMMDFGVNDDKHWCDLCGSSGGKCSGKSGSNDGDASKSNSSGNGVSKPVAGVIGALVTLVVILSAEAAVVLVGGFRLVKKSALATKAPAEAVKA